MQKTKFAGLTVLEANESIYSDNSAFIGRDRFEIDRELEIGVKTHRHDGTEGLSGPIVAPSGLVIGSGGSLPAGRSLTIGVSYEDIDGGETVISPTNLITTPSPVQSPTNQLTAEADYTAGTLSVDTYTYAITLVDAAGGETPLGPPVTVTRDPGFANARIQLGNLRAGFEILWDEEGVVAYRIYRARAGGEYVFLHEDETNFWTDNGSISPDCDRHPPSFNTNTTGGTSQIEVLVPPVHHPFASEIPIRNVNLYASQSGSFDEDCLVEQIAPGSAYVTTFITSLNFLAHQPPDVTTSHGGADKINPDTELLDYHWKRPVTTKAELASAEGNEEGDVRMVLDEHKPYVLTIEGWEPWATGGGGGGAGSASAVDVFLEGAIKPGTGTVVEDSFDSGELDTNWELDGGETPMSEWWTEEGGEIVKKESGAPGLNKHAVGINGKIVSKFGGEETFFCSQMHILAIGNSEEIRAGFEGGFGHGNPGSKISIDLYGTKEGQWTLKQTTFSEPPVGEYWVVTEFEGSLIRTSLYNEEPVEGVEPIQTLECDLFTEELEEVAGPSDEEREPFIERTDGKFGLLFVGAPGGKTYEWNAEVGFGPDPHYRESVSFIEFAPGAGSALSVGSAYQSGTRFGAFVTVPSIGLMGYAMVGSAGIADERPGYDGVTWVVTGSAGVPTHMKDGDFLYHENSPGVVKSYIRLAGALAAI